MDTNKHTPWIVVMPVCADAPVYSNKEAARAFVERCNVETSGNVEATAMPLAVALEAPAMLEALRNALDQIDRDGECIQEDADDKAYRFAVTEPIRAILARIDGGSK